VLTLHTAESLLPGAGQQPLPGGAVLVDGDRIAGVGPFAELAAAHPAARVRSWPGTLRAGLAEGGARELLEGTRNPDPRDPARPYDRAESVRRGIHQLLRRGVTAVADDFTDPAVRAAVDRGGLLRGRSRDPALAVGARADLAVFAPDGECVATVLAGRLVHRRR
jgi:cytosine/adenosine deaminase-related metal-dependent hydrolase